VERVVVAPTLRKTKVSNAVLGGLEGPITIAKRNNDSRVTKAGQVKLIVAIDISQLAPEPCLAVPAIQGVEVVEACAIAILE
jgi:hypothetical protein